MISVQGRNENAPTFLLVHSILSNGADLVIVAEASIKDPLLRSLNN